MTTDQTQPSADKQGSRFDHSYVDIAVEARKAIGCDEPWAEGDCFANLPEMNDFDPCSRCHLAWRLSSFEDEATQWWHELGVLDGKLGFANGRANTARAEGEQAEHARCAEYLRRQMSLMHETIALLEADTAPVRTADQERERCPECSCETVARIDYDDNDLRIPVFSCGWSQGTTTRHTTFCTRSGGRYRCGRCGTTSPVHRDDCDAIDVGTHERYSQGFTAPSGTHERGER